MRDLNRTRRKLVGSMASEKNRLIKVLEDANIKLSSALNGNVTQHHRFLLKMHLDNIEFFAKQIKKSEILLIKPFIVTSLREEGGREL